MKANASVKILIYLFHQKGTEQIKKLTTMYVIKIYYRLYALKNLLLEGGNGILIIKNNKFYKINGL